MLPGAPPFVEVEAVLEVRRLAARLASSPLPILVAGAIGTGRRTLANALGSLRDSNHRTFSAFDGLEAVRLHREPGCAVVIHNVHALDARGQNELAALVHDRQMRVTATVDASYELTADMEALVAATRVTLPPLRDRGSDVGAWAKLFLQLAATQLGRAGPRLTPAGENALLSQKWPGNLSELLSVVQRAAVLGSGEEVGPAELGFSDAMTIVGGVQPLADAVEAFRMAYVLKVLAHFDGNRSQTARALGVDPRTIFRYLAKDKPG
jgi:DNA-binding NtrC family response regulator